MRIPRPTFTSAIAMLALFVALGGSSYAAIQISGASIKNGTVTGKDLKNGSVKGADVGNASLLAKDFKPGQLPTGAAGPKGPTGPSGPQGPTGPQGPPGPADVVVRRLDVTIPAVPAPLAPSARVEYVTAAAKCAPGERALGGGGGITLGRDGGAAVLMNEPAVGTDPAVDGQTPTGWLATGSNAASEEAEMRVHAVCVTQ